MWGKCSDGSFIYLSIYLSFSLSLSSFFFVHSCALPWSFHLFFIVSLLLPLPLIRYSFLRWKRLFVNVTCAKVFSLATVSHRITSHEFQYFRSRRACMCVRDRGTISMVTLFLSLCSFVVDFSFFNLSICLRAVWLTRRIFATSSFGYRFWHKYCCCPAKSLDDRCYNRRCGRWMCSWFCDLCVFATHQV